MQCCNQLLFIVQNYVRVRSAFVRRGEDGCENRHDNDVHIQVSLAYKTVTKDLATRFITVRHCHSNNKIFTRYYF